MLRLRTSLARWGALNEEEGPITNADLLEMKVDIMEGVDKRSEKGEEKVEKKIDGLAKMGEKLDEKIENIINFSFSLPFFYLRHLLEH